MDEIPSTQSDTEWTVVISKFESFNKFYVQKVEDKYNLISAMKSDSLLTFDNDKSKDLTQRPHTGSIIETLTDKDDGIWYEAQMIAADDNTGLIVRVLNDDSICKSTKMKDLPVNGEKLIYRCYIDEDSEEDELTNNTYNFNIISNIMLSREWTMKTSSDREPYKVTLTINGEDCFDIICKLLPPLTDDENAENSHLSLSVDDGVAQDKDVSIVIEEKSKHNSSKINVNTVSALVVPQTETVTVKNFKTFKCFFAKSECLFTLYMERIIVELEKCIPLNPKFKNTVGSIMVALDKSLGRRFRVLVESISSHGTNCYLLDYGEYDVFKEFYKPTEFLRTCPPIVRRCSLYAPKLIGKEDEIWFPDVDDIFKDILFIECIKFDMTIIDKGSWRDPCVVSLMLDNVDISEMLCPINVQVTHVNSLTDFRIKAISDEQKTMTALLESVKVPKVIVENPVCGNLYLAESKSILKRVKLDSFGGIKYVVNDVDNTLDNFSVHILYEIPKSIRDIPLFTMACSLILHDNEDAHFLDAFKYLVDQKVVFIMSIITENDGKKPNIVKLYHNDKSVLDVLKSMKKVEKNN